MNISPLGFANISVSGTSNMTPIDTSMLKKSLDSTEVAGAALIKMMEQSVNPNIGSNFDMSI